MNEILNKLKYNQQGLIAAVAQDYKTKEVLMQAWMNKESIELTLKTGLVTYFSRSRGQLWQKGATSGNMQKLVKFSIDCDYDCILLQVNQTGNACHTGAKSCFFNEI